MTSDPKYWPLLADPAFWANVDIRGPGDCWPYKDGIGSVGPYGHVRIWRDGQRVYAHRVAFALAGGVLEETEIVTHGCDNGACCSWMEGHLRAGTIQSNNLERDLRNRRTPFLPRGTDHPSAKLTVQTLEVVRRGRGRVDVADLAFLVGVSPSTIYNAWAGRHYRDEPDGPERRVVVAA